MDPPNFQRVARSRTPTDEGPKTLRVWLLGGFRVWVGSRTIEESAWGLKKAAALVKFLALAPGHRLHREQAMDLLWPDLGRKAASNNLRRILHTARRVLDPAAGSHYLVSEDELLVLCPQGDLWVDAEAFEAAARTDRHSREPAVYEAALDLYYGELLPGDRYEEWAEEPRRRLQETHLSLLLGLARLHEERGEYKPAIEALRTVVAEELTREEAHTGLMRLYALSGNKGEALVQYSRLKEALATELGTEPAASSRALRKEISVGRFPSLGVPSLGSPPEELLGAGEHNLPAPRTSFVGREREMVELKRTLSMTRLLTLTGAGGSGKTRLAVEMARDLISVYPGGVWLVELAPLSEAALVPKAVAEALEIPERRTESLTDTLAEVLRERQLLLILDNCEHLVEAAAELVNDLLDACPRLRVLATSREPLDLEGEIIWQVAPLSLPVTIDEGLDGGSTVESLMRYEAVRLFVERARLRLPDFGLTQENAQAVARMCRKLDGIPLAIELATARMGALTVEQVAQRFEASLDVLKGTSRGAEPRQKTLRATLDWSYNLLSEAEQALFRRLSVFAGGWTLEAAEVVCSAGGIGQEDVLDLLSGLVDKSLVVARTSTGRAVRYRMLEPIRQYARVKLEESGETEEIRRQHAEYLVVLAEEEPEAFKGSQQPEWTRRLEEEHDNLRAALSWSLESGEVELGLRLAGAAQPFWAKRGHYKEGRRWLEATLAKDAQVPEVVRANALRGVGWLALWQADIDRAASAAEEGLPLSSPTGYAGVAIDLRILLGFTVTLTATHLADYEQATELFEESLKLSKESGDRWGIAASLLQLGNVSGEQGHHKQAMKFYEDSLGLCRKLGYAVLLADTLTNLGYESLLEGEHERATALNEEAAALYREQGFKDARLEYPLDNLGWAALLGGDHERARTLHEQSLILCRKLGNKWIAAACLEGLACAAGVRKKAERSARLFGAAEVLREEVGIPQLPAERVLREPYLATARSQLGEAAWEVAVAEGRAMSFEEAIEYALSEDRSASPASPTLERPLAGGHPCTLTPREEDVAVLVVRGLTNRQIASELSISEHTAATHVRRILKKLGLRSRVELAGWVSSSHPPLT
jgi:predicted ATPase/DNA-binding SARP family transcriptional activator/DNA-binding CsgD family transcriptional regulator